MNTFWLKVAGVAVGVVAVIVGIGVFTSSDDSPAEPPVEQEQKPKTIYDMADRDKERFLSKPEPVDSNQESPAPAEQQAVSPPPERLTRKTLHEAPKPSGPVTLYFAELGEIDRIEAERLLNVAVPGRSIGRLPMTGFKLMVDNCRAIIQRWPDSWYAYRAKQMMADMPPRYQMRYKVTKDEMDLSMFAKPRPGTKPLAVKGTR
jgi:hypothetical protein